MLSLETAPSGQFKRVALLKYFWAEELHIPGDTCKHNEWIKKQKKITRVSKKFQHHKLKYNKQAKHIAEIHTRKIITIKVEETKTGGAS